MSEGSKRYARAEVSLDGRHVDARLIKIDPAEGDLQRLRLTFPIGFFLGLIRSNVEVVVEFDPPIPSDWSEA